MYPYEIKIHPYKIKEGDTIWGIAEEHQTTVDDILALNTNLDPKALPAGQIIYVPKGYSASEERRGCEGIGPEEAVLGCCMRRLWLQQIYWRRIVMSSMVFGLPDEEEVTERLRLNARDFKDMLLPFYGTENAKKFEDLLREQLRIAGEFLNASKERNTAEIADAEKRGYENADQMAGFLAELNPNWPKEVWKNMLYNHLAMSRQEMVDFLTQHYTESIEVFGQVEQGVLEMSKEMTQGIVRQFPQDFE